MKWSSLHVWVIGICVLEALNVNSIDIEKIKSKNKDHKCSIFHKSVPSVDLDFDVKIDTLLTDSLNNLFRFERDAVNETFDDGKRDMKNAPNKIIYNKKKHLMRTIRADDKSHDKRENLLMRLFSDPLKPFEMRPTIKKKRDSNGYTKKLEIITNTTKNMPIISQFALPFPHFAMDRKVNDDKICKTHIFEIFPKQFKKRLEAHNEKGNGSRKDVITATDNSNNDWELRQDIFVEEFLPSRERSDSIYKYGFHDDVRTIFDDMLDLFTMLPSFFDSVVIKMSTQKPKTSTNLIDSSVGDSNLTSTTSNDNVRNRRQASETISNSTYDKSITTNASTTELEISSTQQSIVVTNKANTSQIDTIMTNTTNVTVVIKSGNTSENLVNMNNSTSLNKTTTNTTLGVVTKNAHINAISISSPVVHNAKTTEGNEVLNVSEAVKNISLLKLDDVNSTDQSIGITTTLTESAKLRSLDANSDKKENLFELHFADMERDDITISEAEQTTKPPSQSNDKSAFLIVLAVIPGLIGLVIAVGVVGIWFIQKNSPWFDRNNTGNDPTTSHSQAKPTCNI